MALYSVEGIIINTRNFGEADKVVTIFAKEKGKVEAIAKSARKIKSRKSSSIELLNYAKFSIAKGKNLDIITEIQLIDGFITKLNPDFYNLVFYFSELLNKAFSVNKVEENVWKNLIKLRSLFSKSPYLITIKLQLFLLLELGVLPNLLNCQICNKSLKQARFARKNYVGYFCAEHKQNGFLIKDRYLKVQNFLLHQNIEKLYKLQLDENDVNFLLELQNNWIECIIETQIKSYKLLYF